MKSNVEIFEIEYLQLSVEQVKLEVWIESKLSVMNTTCSYYDYMELQSEVNSMIDKFDWNERQFKLLKFKIDYENRKPKTCSSD